MLLVNIYFFVFDTKYFMEKNCNITYVRDGDKKIKIGGKTSELSPGIKQPHLDRSVTRLFNLRFVLSSPGEVKHTNLLYYTVLL